MSTSPSEPDPRLDDFDRQAARVRSQLQENGPEVNFRDLYLYIDGELDTVAAAEIRRRIYSWKNWFDAYWQLRTELHLAAADSEEEAANAAGRSSATEDQSSQNATISNYLADEAARYLEMGYAELLDEFSLFAGSSRSEDLLAPHREKLRRIICQEWSWSRQRHDPRWQEPKQLAAQLTALLEARKDMLGLPSEALPIMAAILVQEGLDHLCNPEG